MWYVRELPVCLHSQQFTTHETISKCVSQLYTKRTRSNLCTHHQRNVMEMCKNWWCCECGPYREICIWYVAFKWMDVWKTVTAIKSINELRITTRERGGKKQQYYMNTEQQPFYSRQVNFKSIFVTIWHNRYVCVCVPTAVVVAVASSNF